VIGAADPVGSAPNRRRLRVQDPIDLVMTPQMAADPYPIYEAVRPRTPLMIANAMGRGGGRLWPLMKYQDVYQGLKDHETFSSAQQGEGGGMPLVLLNNDPPRHTRMRRLVSKAFTPRRIAEVEPWIKETSDRLFDEMGSGQVEAVWNYTVPLPVLAIAKILGIPGEEYQTFKRWTDSLLSFSPTEEARQRRMEDLMAMMAYFGKMAADRRAQGAEDLITALVESETEEGKLDDWEVLGFCMLLLIAGNETTTNLMGNLLHYLAAHPGLYAQVRADRDLVEPCIEEMLRLESPVQVLFRTTVKDAHLPSGGFIPAGEPVGMFYGAANRDPDGWPEPDTFRLDRNLKDHVAFGMGVHYCLGSPLARAEARITLNNLLDRYSRVELDSKPSVRQTDAPIVYGFRHLYMTLRP
jgi:hypothetical protein